MSLYFLLSYKGECNLSAMGEKKVFSTRLDCDLVRKLKHLAVDEDESLGDLLEEAVQDLLKKYEEKLKK
jgi:predicted transcriptional regulator